MCSITISVAAVAMWTAAVTAKVHADTGIDSVLNSSGTAGASSAGVAGSPSLGSSVCTAIEQPGQTMASVASALAAQNGTSPQMSKFLTALSISVSCPTMMSALPGDDWLGLLGSTGR